MTLDTDQPAEFPAGFVPHTPGWLTSHLPPGWRPVACGETALLGDERIDIHPGGGWRPIEWGYTPVPGTPFTRTRRPYPEALTAEEAVQRVLQVYEQVHGRYHSEPVSMTTQMAAAAGMRVTKKANVVSVQLVTQAASLSEVEKRKGGSNAVP